MWEPLHEEQANAQGWRLVTTINSGDSHPYWDIATFGERFKSDHAAFAAVLDAAKRGGALHQHALKLVAASRARPAKPAPKRRAGK